MGVSLSERVVAISSSVSDGHFPGWMGETWLIIYLFFAMELDRYNLRGNWDCSLLYFTASLLEMLVMFP
jgi:hypothetical protein